MRNDGASDDADFVPLPGRRDFHVEMTRGDALDRLGHPHHGPRDAGADEERYETAENDGAEKNIEQSALIAIAEPSVAKPAYE